jgi:dihydropteroate synthase
VGIEEELRRVLPVVEGMAARWGGPLSIDTRHSEVARAALRAGARMVNDVSAARDDSAMLELVAEEGCEICLMHMRGTPRDMQEDPHYDEVVAEVALFLRDRVRACLNAGIGLNKIWLDPGIGFGKRLDHNLELLRGLPELRSLSRPLLLGVSRKSFIAHVTGLERPGDWKAP